VQLLDQMGLGRERRKGLQAASTSSQIHGRRSNQISMAGHARVGSGVVSGLSVARESFGFRHSLCVALARSRSARRDFVPSAVV
jgi:hypothetical protein